jgi:hypothetical protein
MDATMSKGKVSVPCMLLVAAAAGAASAAAGNGWERTPAVPAESELFEDRVLEPQYHFLVDGQHASLAGREFHQAYGEGSLMLWPAHPWIRLLPDRRWLADSAAYTFRASVGNEIGDPLLNELLGEDGSVNRTPYSAGSFTWSPTGDWSVNAALDQNDHVSYRTFPAREALVGPSRRDELAWIGGNLPPRSLAQLGGAMHRHGGLISVQANRGWWWTTSPVSGMPYAWKGWNADFHTRAGDDFDLSLVDQSWESAAPGSFQAARWRRTEMTLGFAGGSRGGWRWRLELGGQRRTLYADSSFPTFAEDTYPWRFRYRQGWSPEGFSWFRLENQGHFGARERMFSAQHLADFKETWGPHNLTQGLKGYYRTPFGSYREPTEILNADTTWTAVLDPAQHTRGLSGSLEYRFKGGRFQGSLSGHYASEWGVPVFRGAVVDTLHGLLIRSGVAEGSEHRLTNFGGRAQLGGALWKPAFWRLHGGLRGFEGADADAVELRPSPWWAGAGLGLDLPSRLQVEGLLHFVGPKELRGWGPDFDIPEHLEGNVALTQVLFDDRLKLSAAFLHAFGEEILEHPNGNPLLFRILVRAEGSF